MDRQSRIAILRDIRTSFMPLYTLNGGALIYMYVGCLSCMEHVYVVKLYIILKHQ